MLPNHDVRIAQSLAHDAYTAGNDRGEGYAPYTDEAGDDTIDSAVACFVADGWTLVLERNNSGEVAVVQSGDGELVAIGGDGMGKGAWAVSIVIEEGGQS